MVDSPIFIVGTPRSGTTLTAKILGNHSKLFMPGETHFFDDIYSRRAELGEPFHPESKEKILQLMFTLYGRYNEPKDQKRIDLLVKSSGFKDQLAEKSATYSDILTKFMQVQAESLGKKRWGNNAPRDIFNIDDILEFYKNAKIIVCVRDIRDFLLSYQGKWRSTSENEVERLKKIYHPVVTTLLWKSSMKLLPDLKRKVPEGNLLIMKYEELVTQPEMIVQKICRFIGEKFEPEILNISTSNSSHEKKNRGIFSTSVGRWKDQLSAEEVVISQKIASKEMEGLGYQMANCNASGLKIGFIYISTPFAVCRALFANQKKRGALIPYLLKRVRGLLN